MATENNKNQRFSNITHVQNTVTNATTPQQTALISKSNTILGFIVSDLLA